MRLLICILALFWLTLALLVWAAVTNDLHPAKLGFALGGCTLLFVGLLGIVALILSQRPKM